MPQKGGILFLNCQSVRQSVRPSFRYSVPPYSFGALSSYSDSLVCICRLDLLSVPSAGSMNFVKHLVKKDATKSFGKYAWADLAGGRGPDPPPLDFQKYG